MRAHRICTGLMLISMLLVTRRASAIDLTKDGSSDYQIVLRDGVPAPEETAANVLHETLRKISGVAIPIIAESQADPTKHSILLGPSQRVKELCGDVDWTSLGHDGTVIRTAGDDLILAGGEPRGTMYAVFTFLEDTLGVRWWTSTESFIPHRPNIRIGKIDAVYIPPIKYREAFYEDVINQHYVQAARLKLNGNMTNIPADWGGHYSILGWCHTFYQLLPPSIYFDKHPEWYSLIKGHRTADSAQLCLTNDAMREELVKNALAWIRKNPDAGIISIAQNDCGNPCQCDNCQAIAREEGSESGPVIHFVNQVAEEIHRQYPDFLVETLAYQYTRHPPQHVHPSKNVLVRLCSIECNFAHPLASNYNKGFANDMAGWAAISPNMFVWNYVTDFSAYFQPHPNMNSLGLDLKWFVKNHVIGVFEQGDAYNAGAGDFLQLRAWLLAHLLWNPNLDQRTLRDEILNGYYGPAGKYLGEYLDLMNGAAEQKAGFALSTYNRDLSFFTDEMLAKSQDLFVQASKAVSGDPVLSRRVRRERLPLDLLAIQRFDFDSESKAARAAGKDPFETVMPQYEALVDDFQRTADVDGAKAWGEGYPFDAGINTLRSRAANMIPPMIPPAGAKLPANEFDVQQDRFELYGKGQLTSIVDDAGASDQKAARMTTDHTQWAIQFHIDPNQMPAGNGPWRCFLLARVDAIAKSGTAFRYGAFDGPRHIPLFDATAPIERFSGTGYTPIGISLNKLPAGDYIWIAPVANPKEVKAIYVDRLFFIRDKR